MKNVTLIAALCAVLAVSGLQTAFPKSKNVQAKQTKTPEKKSPKRKSSVWKKWVNLTNMADKSFDLVFLYQVNKKQQKPQFKGVVRSVSTKKEKREKMVLVKVSNRSERFLREILVFDADKQFKNRRFKGYSSLDELKKREDLGKPIIMIGVNNAQFDVPAFRAKNKSNRTKVLDQYVIVKRGQSYVIEQKAQKNVKTKTKKRAKNA